jgi:hypothetical protein
LNWLQVVPVAAVGEEAVAAGDGELLATTGEVLAAVAGDGLIPGFAEDAGEEFGVGLADPLRAESAESELDRFEFGLPRRCGSAAGGAGPASLRTTLRLAAADPLDREPGMVKTTSSLLPCCSTRALAPGCNRNETTVSLAPRWTLTSLKARPRTASGRGTSAAGIRT